MTTTPAATGGLAPIETKYADYKFRSRLEARWALYFDLCEVRWAYEAEGFTLSDGQRYLPDFWLPDYNQFVEVKPISDHIQIPSLTNFQFLDWQEPGNTPTPHGEPLMVRIDDDYCPPTADVFEAIKREQQTTPYTIAIICCDCIDRMPFGIQWCNKSHGYVAEDRADAWRVGAQKRYEHFVPRHKHYQLGIDTQLLNIGVRVVFGDPREMKHVCNATTRELPFNHEAAVAARQYRFEGRTP